MIALPADTGRLASWAGVAPGANERVRGEGQVVHLPPRQQLPETHSGNRRDGRRAEKGTFLSARCKRIMTRRGHRRALVAVARTILHDLLALLATGQPCRDLGADYYAAGVPAQPSRPRSNACTKPAATSPRLPKGSSSPPPDKGTQSVARAVVTQLSGETGISR